MHTRQKCIPLISVQLYHRLSLQPGPQSRLRTKDPAVNEHRGAPAVHPFDGQITVVGLARVEFSLTMHAILALASAVPLRCFFPRSHIHMMPALRTSKRGSDTP